MSEDAGRIGVHDDVGEFGCHQEQHVYQGVVHEEQCNREVGGHHGTYGNYRSTGLSQTSRSPLMLFVCIGVLVLGFLLVIPGAVVLMLASSTSGTAGGVTLLVLGVVLLAVGLLSFALLRRRDSEDAENRHLTQAYRGAEQGQGGEVNPSFTESDANPPPAYGPQLEQYPRPTPGNSDGLAPPPSYGSLPSSSCADENNRIDSTQQ